MHIGFFRSFDGHDMKKTPASERRTWWTRRQRRRRWSAFCYVTLSLVHRSPPSLSLAISPQSRTRSHSLSHAHCGRRTDGRTDDTVAAAAAAAAAPRWSEKMRRKNVTRVAFFSAARPPAPARSPLLPPRASERASASAVSDLMRGFLHFFEVSLATTERASERGGG